jgi:methylmalonyl-CoA/ethylmalonyl-CoA epimerase
MNDESTSAAGRPAFRFQHVGIAVRDLERSLRVYRELFGFRTVGEPVEVPTESVRVCFVEATPGVRLELIEGLDADSRIEPVLERQGPGPYHLCYEVDDLDAAVRSLRAGGCRPFRDFPSPVSSHSRFVFLYTPDLQLIELCEAVSAGGSES